MFAAPISTVPRGHSKGRREWDHCVGVSTSHVFSQNIKEEKYESENIGRDS